MKSLGTLSDIDALTQIVNPAGKKWLDIGCGDGTLACQLAELDAVVTGIEPDPIQAEKNRTLTLPENVILLRGEAQDLPMEDDSMDAVIFSYSLHHVPVAAMETALAEACRVLTQKGFLCVVEPVAEGPYHRAIELFHDETKVRAAAIEALKAYVQPNFESESVYSYSTINCYSSFSEFTKYMLGLTYNKFDPHVVKSDAVRERFESCRIGQGYALEQPMRVNMFNGLLGA